MKNQSLWPNLSTHVEHAFVANNSFIYRDDAIMMFLLSFDSFLQHFTWSR